MTRLAVVGSSHMGTIRQSDARIRAACPGLEIAYFGLPGAPFRRARRDVDGVLRVDAENQAEARMIRRINGADAFDLGPFDHIWIVGFRFGLGTVLALLKRFDVLEMGRTGLPNTISEAFFWAAMQAEIDRSCDVIAANYGPDQRITISPAPYPAEKAREKGPHHEPPLAHVLQHPECDRIFARFEGMIGASLTARGYRFLPQPPATLAAPFATQSAHLLGARDFRDTSVELTDLRHMNAEYGFALFRAFAELHPALGCFIASTETS